MLFFTIWSCHNRADIETSNLAGTKWKLVGIVDTHMSDTTAIKPIDCEECYTLMFDTNSTLLFGKSVANIVVLISLNPIQIQCGTYANECYSDDECNVYCNALHLVKSYTYNENELKLHFQDINNYLLYKRIRL